MEEEQKELDQAPVAPDPEGAIQLDYKLKTCEERAALVEKIVAQAPQDALTKHYLEILGDYIMGGISKEEKKEKLYLTNNRQLTINKRETSFEGLAEKFENGEDGIYNLMTNDKNMLFQPRHTIDEKDLEEVPGLRELREAMEQVEEAGKHATGRNKYLLKKQLIEMRRDQYVLRAAHKPQMKLSTSPKGINKIDLSERRYVDENGEPCSTGLISFFNPAHISALMTHYNALKIETRGRYWDDFFYLLEDFDELLHKSLKDYPMYLDIVKMKMDGKTNQEIQSFLEKEYNKKHTVQYISSLWCSKIPKLIAEYEQNEFLLWYYKNVEKGTWKRCSSCHEWKLASPRFFTRNSTSKDSFYSVCKTCRNKKPGQF